MKNKNILRMFVPSSAGLIGGILAALITAIISVLFGLSNTYAIIMVVFLSAILTLIFSWLLRKYAEKTLYISIILLLIIGFLMTLLSSNRDLWATVHWDLAVFSVGVSIISLGIAILALYYSQKSDKRMQAMADLEFYEKIAVIENYLFAIKNHQTFAADAVYYDIKAAMQLIRYASTDAKTLLKSKIQQTIGNASQCPTCINVVQKLQELLKEYPNL